MNQNDKPKRMTLDRLAQLVARGFENAPTKTEMTDGFQQVNNRIHNVEQKVDKLDFKMDEVHDMLKRFEEHDIVNLQKRVQILEKAVRASANQTSK